MEGRTPYQRTDYLFWGITCTSTLKQKHCSSCIRTILLDTLAAASRSFLSGWSGISRRSSSRSLGASQSTVVGYCLLLVHQFLHCLHLETQEYPIQGSMCPSRRLGIALPEGAKVLADLLWRSSSHSHFSTKTALDAFRSTCQVVLDCCQNSSLILMSHANSTRRETLR